MIPHAYSQSNLAFSYSGSHVTLSKRSLRRKGSPPVVRDASDQKTAFSMTLMGLCNWFWIILLYFVFLILLIFEYVPVIIKLYLE